MQYLHNTQIEVISNEFLYFVNLQTFPGSQRSGCMQVNPTGLIYHFQMSAVSAVNGIQIEGTLSSLSAMSTVYVPSPGIVCIYTCTF